jgi:hypothetical protein
MLEQVEPIDDTDADVLVVRHGNQCVGSRIVI